jgi:hypothetical protein
MVPDNFQEEDIVAYYESTAPIYAKAFARMQKSGRKAGAAKKNPRAKKGAPKRR